MSDRLEYTKIHKTSGNIPLVLWIFVIEYSKVSGKTSQDRGKIGQLPPLFNALPICTHVFMYMCTRIIIADVYLLTLQMIDVKNAFYVFIFDNIQRKKTLLFLERFLLIKTLRFVFITVVAL